MKIVKTFNEMNQDEKPRQSVYVQLRNGRIVNRMLYIQYFKDGKPFIAHDGPGRGIGGIFYEFALTYDDMINKFVTNSAKKQRLKTIKNDYLNFMDTKEVGTKVYIKDSENNTDDYLECVWDGDRFTCGRHMFFDEDEILNRPIWFQKPEGKNIVTDWYPKGYEWSDTQKSWIRKNKR